MAIPWLASLAVLNIQIYCLNGSEFHTEIEIEVNGVVINT
jgi:hypothetical protein